MSAEPRLRVGLPAPDFELPCVLPGGATARARLADHRGRWVALVFYPRDFSMVCPTELTGASARMEAFRQLDCVLLGISVDPPEAHARWMRTPQHEGGVEGLAFPLASDVDGAVARAYGVFDEDRRVALRGLFLVDPEGRLQCQMVLPLTVGRGTDETLRILGALRTGGLCPVDWRGGDGIELDEQLRPGRIVARYRIEAPLGAGGFAHVFRATDLALDRTVALKVFRPRTRATITAMLSEARLAAALTHPNVCTIFDVDDSEGVPLLTMECLEGTTLARRVFAKDLGPCEAGRVLAGIARGLAAAHDRHVVHGDLKPGNVMVLPDGDAKILDFGLARRADPSDLAKTREGATSGTPRYMAPERFRGRPTTGAADVFAYGLLVYEAFTQKAAFPTSSVVELVRLVSALDPETYAAAVPEPWDDIVRRALVPEPERRTITMREIARLLEA